MPVIDGQVFAEHEYREYPKALYPNGAAYDDGKPVTARIVSNPEEEAEAVAEGFAAISSEGAADEGEALSGGDAAEVPEEEAEPEVVPEAEEPETPVAA